MGSPRGWKRNVQTARGMNTECLITSVRKSQGNNMKGHTSAELAAFNGFVRFLIYQSVQVSNAKHH